MVARTDHLDVKLDEYFYLDDSIPNGIRWKKAPFKSRVQVDSPAGYFRDRYWVVVIKKHGITTGRVVYCLSNSIPTLRGIEGSFIDHIDGNTDNNSAANLRIASNQQNQLNRLGNAQSTSRFKGVSIAKGNREKKFVAFFYTKEKRYFGGYFLTEEEAALRYDELAIEHTKPDDRPFLKLNFLGAKL